jgi:hypothetical protein
MTGERLPYRTVTKELYEFDKDKRISYLKLRREEQATFRTIIDTEEFYAVDVAVGIVALPAFVMEKVVSIVPIHLINEEGKSVNCRMDDDDIVVAAAQAERGYFLERRDNSDLSLSYLTRLLEESKLM